MPPPCLRYRVELQFERSNHERAATERYASSGTAEKDPSEWVTGDQPMTGPQKSYLNTLAQDAGEEAV